MDTFDKRNVQIVNVDTFINSSDLFIYTHACTPLCIVILKLSCTNHLELDNYERTKYYMILRSMSLMFKHENGNIICDLFRKH